MGRPIRDLSGQRFGSLVVIAQDGVTTRGMSRWRVLCDCGAFGTVQLSALTHAGQRSCGCNRRK
jgi:hypothetical protein